MMCSARSFSSDSSRVGERFVLFGGFAARHRAGDRAAVVTWPSSTSTSSSGEAPTIWYSPKFRKYMYGLGLIERRARYRLTGLADVGTDRRCEGTIWKHSPAAMASLA